MTSTPASRVDPPPSVAQLDEWSLELLAPVHAPLVVQLLNQRGHRYLLDIPADAATIAGAIAALSKEPWTLPLAVVRGSECIGMATTALPNIKALHASLTTLFVEPAESTLPLAMCVRHLLWMYPLHRLYAHIPAMDLTREYVELLRSVGFVEEGTLKDHAVIGGQRFDMVALGLLRQDFESWAQAHEPRLALT